VVIVGAGQAGFQAAASLRMEAYDAPITLIGEEPSLPYQRPPLSKGFLEGKQNVGNVELRPDAYYRDHKIDLISGSEVIRINRANRSVELRSGQRFPYETLILAIGSRVRKLSVKGAELDEVCYLRTLDDAIRIRQRLETARDIVVVGGGFIGLEVAAVARSMGKSVAVVEAQSRLMPRAVAPVISDFYQELHLGHGVQIHLATVVREIAAGQVFLSDGSAHKADLVIVGIGVLPNVELAQDGGLTVADGIVVDEYLRTEDSNIYAIGDCAQHPNPFAGQSTRIESVQNAVDQARCVAANIAGRGEPYRAVPWFWTDQFDIKLQMVGLSGGSVHLVTRGNPTSRKFSVFYFKEDRLAAIDSINRPGDHLVGRKLLAAGTALTPDQAADERLDLKSLQQQA
jgi:3-phenylpropionate/trans-cinnamate dioxygenase ferredoxin reductase subunit